MFQHITGELFPHLYAFIPMQRKSTYSKIPGVHITVLPNSPSEAGNEIRALEEAKQWIPAVEHYLNESGYLTSSSHVMIGNPFLRYRDRFSGIAHLKRRLDPEDVRYLTDAGFVVAHNCGSRIRQKRIWNGKWSFHE